VYCNATFRDGNIEAMSSKSLLSAKQERFVAEYLCDYNATQAAIRAGYSARSARQIAGVLLTKDDIAAELHKRQSAVLKRLDVTAERVVKELAWIAFFDPMYLFDAQGNLLPINRMPEEARRALSFFKVGPDGDVTIRFANKVEAIQLLARMIDMREPSVSRDFSPRERSSWLYSD
jgi:phage terminase small subunit